MNLNEYDDLRVKFEDKNYETKFKWFDKFLFLASFGGNAAAIFFAFFLLYPLLNKMISTHITGGTFAVLLGGFFTIAFLTVFELIKREIVKVFSVDFVKAQNKIKNWSNGIIFIILLVIVGSSYFLSLKGAIEFSKTSEGANTAIVSNNTLLTDSLTLVNESNKKPIVDEIENLRKSNKELRDKRDNTPLNYRAARTEYNTLIKDNEQSIEDNLIKIKKLDQDLLQRIKEIKAQENQDITSNTSKDSNAIFIFFIVSTIIEIAIIVGVFFRQKYQYQSYVEAKVKLEPIMKKKEKYSTLLKIIYRNGEIKVDDQVISLSKLTEMMKSKGGQYSAKAVKEFYDEMTQLGVFNVVSNKRFALVDYEEAKRQLETLENI
jgi:hypothetical protein